MARLESFLTLQEAAAKYKISAEVLTHFANSGKIRAVRLNGNGGEIAVAEEDVEKAARELALEDCTELKGKGIRVSNAAEKYGIPYQTLSRWAYAKRIRIMEQGPRLLIVNEADVARAAKLAAELGMRQGKGVITEPVYEVSASD